MLKFYHTPLTWVRINGLRKSVAGGKSPVFYFSSVLLLLSHMGGLDLICVWIVGVLKKTRSINGELMV